MISHKTIILLITVLMLSSLLINTFNIVIVNKQHIQKSQLKIQPNNNKNAQMLLSCPKNITISLYYAPWCGACKMYWSEWERLKKLCPNIKFVEINGDTNNDNNIVIKYYPTIIINKDGIEHKYTKSMKSEDIINNINDNNF